ncbi:MAG: hypothetical protein V1729_02520 [Candidatus Woesearchaeota archaeon]
MGYPDYVKESDHILEAVGDQTTCNGICLTDIVNKTVEFAASPAGIAIGAGAGAAILTAVITNYIQQREANIFPEIFSHSDRIQDTNEAVEFYSAVNDMTMSVMRAWNLARSAKAYPVFTKEMGRQDVNRYLQKVDYNGKAILNNLGRHRGLADASAEAADMFKTSWKYTSEDNYIYVPVTSIDSKGKTHTRLERRYSNTDHYFTFYPENAKSAQEKLSDILNIYEPAELYNPSLAVQITPDGNDMKSISRTVYEDEAKFESLDAMTDIFTQWAKKAKIVPALSGVSDTLRYLDNGVQESFSVINASDSRYHYNTTSRSHSGPEGYRRTKELRNACKLMSGNIRDLESSVKMAMASADSLQKLLDSPNVKKKIKPKKTAHAALDIAVETYLASFPDSAIKMDQRVSTGWTVFLALGIGVAAGIAAYVFNPASGVF